ncbi:MAG: molybdate ABC transporter substrate-binding protein [bacterium]
MPSYLIKTWIALIAIALFGCSSENSSQETARPLKVFAAASLTSVMPIIAESFQRKFPKATLEFNFAASSLLAKQIYQGADADIYLSANDNWIQFLAARNRIQPDTQAAFLSNELVLITSRTAADRLKNLHDLLSMDIQRIALADWSHVPAGIYAKAALQKAGIWEKIRGKCIPALDVRAALTYVERGDVECGIVYRSDALTANKVVWTNFIGKELQPDIHYYIAIVQKSTHPLNKAFHSFLFSPSARQIFNESGFVIANLD